MEKISKIGVILNADLKLNMSDEKMSSISCILVGIQPLHMNKNLTKKKQTTLKNL